MPTIQTINDFALGFKKEYTLLSPEVADFHDDYWMNSYGFAFGDDADVYVGFHVSERIHDVEIQERLGVLYPGMTFEIDYMDPVLD